MTDYNSLIALMTPSAEKQRAASESSTITDDEALAGYRTPSEADVLRIIAETIITETITQIEVNHHEDCAIETELDGQRAIHTYRAEYLVEPIAKAVLDALKANGVRL